MLCFLLHDSACQQPKIKQHTVFVQLYNQSSTHTLVARRVSSKSTSALLRLQPLIIGCFNSSTAPGRSIGSLHKHFSTKCCSKECVHTAVRRQHWDKHSISIASQCTISLQLTTTLLSLLLRRLKVHYLHRQYCTVLYTTLCTHMNMQKSTVHSRRADLQCIRGVSYLNKYVRETFCCREVCPQAV
jgi:hypothetical protein